MAGSYELTHDREYYAIRNSAALIDVSPLYKYHLQGPDAQAVVNRMVTRDVNRCALHQVMYTPWCDEAGKVLDDGTVTRLDEQTFRLTAAEPNLHWITRLAEGFDVTVTDRSRDLAAVALQGPTARDLLAPLVDIDLAAIRFFRSAPATLAGIPVHLTRTGYTGDLGYEIWVEAPDAETLWDSLIAHGQSYGITPTGILALDVARIEAGLILIDVDYVPAHRALIESRKSSPFELGLGWTVPTGGDPFLGSAALRAERARPSPWRLRGLALDWEDLERVFGAVGLPPQLPTVAWRTSVPVYAGTRNIGYATSGCWSPILKQYIALAHLTAPHHTAGSRVHMEVTVEHHRKRVVARVCETPFFDPARKRA